MNDTLPTPEVSDQELTNRMLRRDNQAWRQFLHRYERLIYSCIDKVLCRFAGSSVVLERDEVYSALLSSLLQHEMHKLRAFEFERGYRLGTWLAMLATNAAWDHVRSAVRRRATPYSQECVDATRYAEDASATLIARDHCHRLTDACSGLSPRDREFFELLYLRDAEPEEIAAKLGISVKTVYSKKHKLRARLSALCST